MSKIINLLATAKEAKLRVVAKYNAASVKGFKVSDVFICHAMQSKENAGVKTPWQLVVEPYFNSQIRLNGFDCNNIYSYVIDITYGWMTSHEQRCDMAEIVRIKWLDDLIAAAEQYGDDAELPTIMSPDEIVALYKELSNG